MSSPPKPETELIGPGLALDPTAIREQLRRLLAHRLFTHSKRYPVLLAYTVEQTLLGNASDLKERTIGIEAFGRDPGYDVNLDPVVRTTAAEVRKRLIQYYYSPEHAGEPIIELSAGSYVPSFRAPAGAAPFAQAETALDESTLAAAELAAVAEASPPHGHPSLKNNRRRWGAIGAALALALLLGIALGRIKSSQPPSSLERFWAPMTRSPRRITYCLGMPINAGDHAKWSQGTPVTGGLDTFDVVALARSLVPLAARHDAFRVKSASQTSFAELRHGPIVLIGAFDNIWTMRIARNLPFGFDTQNRLRMIVDRRGGHGRSWTLQWQVPQKVLAKDYAIVARIHDTVTGEPVIILAGILGEGTEAASEVVSNPVYLHALLKRVPKDWEQANLEAVIATDVIDGHPGPPHIVAVTTW